MQLYNVMLAVGGGRDHTYPLDHPVTAAEIVILRALHGDDAVYDIEAAGREATDEEGRPLTNRALRGELRLRYQQARDRDGNVVFDELFPGVSAQMPESIEDLGLPEDLFKALARAVPEAPKPKRAKAAPVAAEPDQVFE